MTHRIGYFSEPNITWIDIGTATLVEILCVNPACGKLLYGKVVFCPFCGEVQQHKSSLEQAQLLKLTDNIPLEQQVSLKGDVPEPPPAPTSTPTRRPKPPTLVTKVPRHVVGDEHASASKRSDPTVKGMPDVAIQKETLTIGTAKTNAPIPKNSNKKWAMVATAMLLAAVIGIAMVSRKGNLPPTLPNSTKVEEPMRHIQAEPKAMEASIDLPKAERAIRSMLTAQIEHNEDQFLNAKASLDGLEKPLHRNRKAARQHDREGLRMLRQNQISGAITEFSLGVQSDPADVELLANLGFAKFKANDANGATNAICEALALSSDRVASWTALAQSLAASGEEDNAVAALMIGYRFAGNKEKITTQFRELRKQQSDERVIAALDRVLKQIGDNSAASQATSVTESRTPSPPPVVYSPPPPPASAPAPAPVQPLPATNQVNNNSVIAGMLDDGDACMANKKFDCAIADATSALRFNPGNVRAQILKQRAEAEQEKALRTITIN